MKSLSQQRRCWRDIGKHKSRFAGMALSSDPATFALNKSGKLGIKLDQGSQRRLRVAAEGISLNHPNIPAAETLLNWQPGKTAGHELLRQCRRQDEATIGTPSMDRMQHPGHPGAMAKAMAADTSNDQHGSAGEQSNNSSRSIAPSPWNQRWEARVTEPPADTSTQQKCLSGAPWASTSWRGTQAAFR